MQVYGLGMKTIAASMTLASFIGTAHEQNSFTLYFLTTIIHAHMFMKHIHFKMQGTTLLRFLFNKQRPHWRIYTSMQWQAILHDMSALKIHILLVDLCIYIKIHICNLYVRILIAYIYVLFDILVLSKTIFVKRKLSKIILDYTLQSGIYKALRCVGTTYDNKKRHLYTS